jgi:hypothetical protein
MPELVLPQSDGSLAPYRLRGTPLPAAPAGPFPRVAYAAAHVVADPRAMADPWNRPAIDWDATIAFREHLWSLGFGVAEAMDTAQRGLGLPWPLAAELIARACAAARARGGLIACGAGTDQLDPAAPATLEDVADAYAAQVAHVERCGGRVVLMASRALCRIARGAEDYVTVYGRLIGEAQAPVILHWLGEAFDPALSGYWGSRDRAAATETFLALVAAHAARIDGVKVSLLDAAHERALRARLPAGVRLYTGDDFNYPELIEGDATGHSHALLGIFDAIAPAAAAALGALGAGDVAGYRAWFAPTVPLARRIFEAPTQYYKAGLVFLAWLNGFQDHFVMAGGLQSARGIPHYADVFRLADAAGLLRDPDRATARMRALCVTAGIG